LDQGLIQGNLKFIIREKFWVRIKIETAQQIAEPFRSPLKLKHHQKKNLYFLISLL